MNYSYNEGAEFRIGHGGPSVWGSKVDFYINGSNNQSGIPDQQVMSWLYNGYVGIRTTTPNAVLDICGSIVTGENYFALTKMPVGLQNTKEAGVVLSAAFKTVKDLSGKEKMKKLTLEACW